MKLYHYVLIFLLFFLAAIIKTDVTVGNLKALESEKNLIQSSLDSATSDAVNYLASSEKFGTNTINREDAVSTFFTSLYSSLGIISDIDAQKEIMAYVPIILICDVDGYYVFYYDEHKDESGKISAERRWSEKMPYYYDDGYFIYRLMLTDTIIVSDIHNLLGNEQQVYELDYHEFLKDEIYKDFRDKHRDCFMVNEAAYELTKKGALINQLEKVMENYTNRYNLIARQNGITYNFSFPAGKSGEWAQYLDDVSMVVVFQGYPYGRDRNYTFNKVSSASANILKKKMYYIEQKSWYSLAHKEGCPKLKNSTSILNETFDNLEQCAALGAYCDDCIEHGARVPEIKKWY